jgi:hypothetical protein
MNISPDDRERASREASTTGGASDPPARPVEEEKPLKIVAGGSITEAIAGAGAVVLAILGLTDMLPMYMAAIATIALGVALLALGGAVASQWSKLVRETSGARAAPNVELGGVGAETFGGAAGVVLGILSLLGILPMILLPIALLVFGGALLLGSGVTVDLSALPDVRDRYAHMTREATLGASGLQALAGMTGIVLGILALVGTMPLTLTLVGLLVLGSAVLLGGSAVSSRMMGILRR